MTTPLQAARALAALADDGCALAAAGRLEELDAQGDAWDTAVAALGPLGALPPEAAALAAHAARKQGEIVGILAAARAQVGDELRRLGQTRRGAQGYAGAGLPSAGQALSASA